MKEITASRVHSIVLPIGTILSIIVGLTLIASVVFLIPNQPRLTTVAEQWLTTITLPAGIALVTCIAISNLTKKKHRKEQLEEGK